MTYIESSNESYSPRNASIGKIGRVQVANAGDLLAENLRSLILSGEIATGAPLPTERELAEESGLSRASVREALKILSVEGLVSVKTGRNGGYWVQEPPRDFFARSLDVFIRGRKITRNSLLELREIIEPMCAALAADRRDVETLENLESLTADMAKKTDDVTIYAEMNIQWHLVVAEASDNEVLASIMTAVSSNIRSAYTADEYRTALHMREAQHLHERVVLAIREQDASAAYRRMYRHLTSASEVLVPAQLKRIGELEIYLHEKNVQVEHGEGRGTLDDV
jgi:DNA-binding FadR family transcriptional regulator